MSGFANSISNAVNQIAYSNPVSSIIDTVTDYAPGVSGVKKTYRLVEKIAFAVVGITILILLITSIALFFEKEPVGGVWTLGAAVALGGFTYWATKLRYNQTKIGGNEEFELWND